MGEAAGAERDASTHGGTEVLSRSLPGDEREASVRIADIADGIRTEHLPNRICHPVYETFIGTMDMQLFLFSGMKYKGNGTCGCGASLPVRSPTERSAGIHCC